MVRFFFSALLALMFSNLGYGQQVITNPELDFVTSASKTPDVSYLPTGNEVYRLDLNLDGNSEPTIFLTFKKWGSRTGNIWIAYTPVAGGYNRVKDGTGGTGVVFRPDGFYAIDPKGGFFVLISGRDGGQLVHYDIQNDTVTMKQVRTVDYANAEDKKYVEGILHHKLEDRKAFLEHPTYKVLSASAIVAGG